MCWRTRHGHGRRQPPYSMQMSRVDQVASGDIGSDNVNDCKGGRGGVTSLSGAGEEVY